MKVLFEKEGWQIVKPEYYHDEAPSYVKHKKCESYTQYFKHTADDTYPKHRCTTCWRVVPKSVQALVILNNWDNI